MMSVEEILPLAGIAVDVFLIGLLGALLHRLSRDPTKVWAERERRVAEIHDSLRLLVSQADGQARVLDAQLGAHTERLRDLMRKGSVDHAAIPPTPTPATVREPQPEACAMRPAAEPERANVSLRVQVAGLARSGCDVEEISRRLDVPLADVRVLVALEQSARARGHAARAGGQE